MAVTCLFLLFVSSVLVAGLLLFAWGRWASGKSGTAPVRVEAQPAPESSSSQLPARSRAEFSARERLALDDSSEFRVADDELAYLWSDTEERRDRWRAEPGSIPPVEELRRAVDRALESGDRKTIAFAKAALADALDPSRLDSSESND